MNAGFSNLNFLKSQLLAPALRAGLTYDDQLVVLGQGMATAIERHCNRQFARVADDTVIIGADRCQFLLPRYPIETISAIGLKLTEANGWVSQTINEFLNTIDLAAGIVNCPDSADAGPWYAQVRFTYTGGYWWNTLEPDDGAYPESLPTGAASLPADLQLAWILQCKAAWQTLDPSGRKLVAGATDAKPANTSGLDTLELIPQVKAMLGNYLRYAL